MWIRAGLSVRWSVRRFCTATRIIDEGDWIYSSEWWGTDDSSVTDSNAQTVFRSISDKGNGVVSVVATPSSRPTEEEWRKREFRLGERYFCGTRIKFKLRGCEWRTLRFNDRTRQSVVKVMAAYPESEPDSVFLVPQQNCLAVPYLKSMVSVGLSTIVSCDYKLINVVAKQKAMRILCIGHGGGSLPLFLASNIKGAIVDIVEIDPVVISASVEAMGFPVSSVVTLSGQGAVSSRGSLTELVWKGTHERLHLYESDAERFVSTTSNIYDLVFIDAYDGDDIFPHKLWDPDSPFLKALSVCLHPKHGTVVVNLHSDSEVCSSDEYQQLLPMTKHVSKVCRAYKDVLLGNGNSCPGKEGFGVAFTVSSPITCNTSLVVSRGFRLNVKSGASLRDMIFLRVLSKSHHVENILQLPFSTSDYIKKDFKLVD